MEFFVFDNIQIECKRTGWGKIEEKKNNNDLHDEIEIRYNCYIYICIYFCVELVLLNMPVLCCKGPMQKSNMMPYLYT